MIESFYDRWYTVWAQEIGEGQCKFFDLIILRSKGKANIQKHDLFHHMLIFWSPILGYRLMLASLTILRHPWKSSDSFAPQPFLLH